MAGLEQQDNECVSSWAGTYACVLAIAAEAPGLLHSCVVQVDYRHAAVFLRVSNPRNWLPDRHEELEGWELPQLLDEVALQVITSLGVRPAALSESSANQTDR